MHIYRTIDTDTDPVKVLDFHGTQMDATLSAKVINKALWPDIRVELIDVPTDRVGILALLNDSATFNPIRTWKMSPRGALTDCANGD